MSENRRIRVEQIFDEAMSLPPSRVTELLALRCGNDESLRREVESLLAHDRGANEAFLAGSDGAVVDVRSVSANIGPFRVLGLIGEGGFGTVYLAEQGEPVRRRVALKVIKLGMDTRQVIARFEAERQALALMDHPNIAKVFEAGQTEQGRPYFAMEYVAGISITAYCDQERLGTDERLAVFNDACDAVQHAHQKGVIHRDIKPSNILVQVVDRRATPKIIDFGIAKAIGASLTDRTMVTEAGQLIGTPEYMSPEQAEMSGLNVDTRTDIYSLGVLLYELLTGALPVEPGTLRSGTLADIRRRIREEEPMRPSTRVRVLGEDADVSARRRRTEPRALARRLRGDLDWIVLKAMEKERGRRYASASEVAGDIRRHLRHEPVLAGPPGAGYRVRKFVRRNRTVVIAALAVTVAVLGGLIGTTSGLLEARRQRNAARQSQHDAEQSRDFAKLREIEAVGLRETEIGLRALAQGEAERAQAVTAFLLETLSLTDPAVAEQPNVSVRVVLDLASARIGRAFAGQPDDEARVRTAMGEAYLALGELRSAAAQLRRAMEIYDSTRAPLADQYPALWSLVMALDPLGEPDSTDWYIRMMMAHPGLLESTQPEIARRWTTMLQAVSVGDAEQAVQITDDVRRLCAGMETGDPARRVLADAMAVNGGVLWHIHGKPEASYLLEEAVRLYSEELGATSPRLYMPVSVLADVRISQGEFARAEEMINGLIQRHRGMYGESRGGVQELFTAQLARLRAAQGRTEEAEALLSEAADSMRVKRGDRGRTYQLVLTQRIALFETMEQPTDAAQMREELLGIVTRPGTPRFLDICFSVFGPEQSQLRGVMQRMKQLSAVGRTSGAERASALKGLLDEFEAERRRVVPSDSALGVILSWCFGNWVDVWEETWLPNDLRERMSVEAIDMMRGWEDRHPYEASRARWGVVHSRMVARDWQAAEAEARVMLDDARRVVGTPGWPAIQKSVLAETLIAQGRYLEAEPLILSAAESLYEELGESNANTASAAARVRRVYRETGRVDDWARLLRVRLHQELAIGANAAQLNELAWEAVRQRTGDAEVISLALRAAQLSTQLRPVSAAALNTLGVALFRAERYEESLQTLSRSDKLYREGSGPQPADWAFITMANRRMGREAQAGQARTVFEDLITQSAFRDDPECVSFAREVTDEFVNTAERTHPR